jgi:hypothetical protein
MRSEPAGPGSERSWFTSQVSERDCLIQPSVRELDYVTLITANATEHKKNHVIGHTIRLSSNSSLTRDPSAPQHRDDKENGIHCRGRRLPRKSEHLDGGPAVPEEYFVRAFMNCGDTKGFGTM